MNSILYAKSIYVMYKNNNKNMFISEQNEMGQQQFNIDSYTPGNPYHGCYR